MGTLALRSAFGLLPPFLRFLALGGIAAGTNLVARWALQPFAGFEIAVARDEMPPAEDDEYYWSDLIGFQVVNLAGESLGRLDGFLETGAHDVMQVKGEKDRLIPFTAPIVDRVELEAKRVVVDWGLDF